MGSSLGVFGCGGFRVFFHGLLHDGLGGLYLGAGSCKEFFFFNS